MHEANGQKESRNPVHAYAIQDKFSRYKAENVDEYRARLRKMSAWDLSDEAVQAGFSPGVERDRMERTLVDEYKKAKTAHEIAIGKYDHKLKTTKPKEPSESVKEMIDFMKH